VGEMATLFRIKDGEVRKFQSVRVSFGKDLMSIKIKIDERNRIFAILTYEEIEEIIAQFLRFIDRAIEEQIGKIQKEGTPLLK